MINFNRITKQVNFRDLEWGNFFVIEWQDDDEPQLCMKTEPMSDRDDEEWNYVTLDTGEYGKMFEDTKVIPARVDIDVDY